jgi:hypothetical protein
VPGVSFQDLTLPVDFSTFLIPSIANLDIARRYFECVREAAGEFLFDHAFDVYGSAEHVLSRVRTSKLRRMRGQCLRLLNDFNDLTELEVGYLAKARRRTRQRGVAAGVVDLSGLLHELSAISEGDFKFPKTSSSKAKRINLSLFGDSVVDGWINIVKFPLVRTSKLGSPFPRTLNAMLQTIDQECVAGMHLGVGGTTERSETFRLADFVPQLEKAAAMRVRRVLGQ